MFAGEGPYDAILCNAALCRYPDARDRDRLDNVFPHATFLDVAERLDAALKPGGLLMMYNANYALTETDLAYTPIPTPPTLNFTTFDNFVSCFGPDGRKRLRIDIQGPASFLDLADSEWERPDAAQQPLAEGLFLKAGGPARSARGRRWRAPT